MKNTKSKESKIKLYSVVCGLWAMDSVFPPYPQMDMSYQPSYKKALEIYNAINGKSFVRKEVLLARLNGNETYVRFIQVVEMPKALYEKGVELEKNGHEGALGDLVFDESVNFNLNDIKLQYFQLTGTGALKGELTLESIKNVTTIKNTKAHA